MNLALPHKIFPVEMKPSIRRGGLERVEIWLLERRPCVEMKNRDTLERVEMSDLKQSPHVWR